MARLRTASVELARLLDAAAQPVYALDEEHKIVFCNQALQDWIGRTADELTGCLCVYRSSPDANSIEAVAAGLCPSPAAMAGQESQGVVACTFADGRSSRRRARFVSFHGNGATVSGLVVLVEPGELAETEASAVTTDNEAARLHEQVRAFRQQVAGRYKIDRLIGESPAMRQVRAQVELAAGSRASVLIVGPPGSGRQHTASAIHYGANRDKSGPLIPLDCAVLGVDLIRSTLVAVAARYSSQGTVRGTLLLSDVEQLPVEAQVDLARMVCARPYPLRIIATARQRLREAVRQGQFREDVAAMLSTLVIDLPPLARRREDLPYLVQLFVEEANARGARQIAGVTPDALDCLDGYAWPGNLDELIQVIDEAHQRAEGPKITLRDLPPQLHRAAHAAAHARRSEEKIQLDQYLARIERELIERALARAKGNKTKAATLLGLNRPRLYRRLVQLGLAEEEVSPPAADSSAVPSPTNPRGKPQE